MAEQRKRNFKKLKKKIKKWGTLKNTAQHQPPWPPQPPGPAALPPARAAPQRPPGEHPPPRPTLRQPPLNSFLTGTSAPATPSFSAPPAPNTPSDAAGGGAGPRSGCSILQQLPPPLFPPSPGQLGKSTTLNSPRPSTLPDHAGISSVRLSPPRKFSPQKLCRSLFSMGGSAAGSLFRNSNGGK